MTDKNQNKDNKNKRLTRLLEFFIIGLALGIIEDLLAIKFATGEPITFKVFVIAALVALPFAALSELIVDKPGFWKKFLDK